MRIGADVAEFWRNPNDPHETEPATRNGARGTLAHSWMQGRLWANDPDCILVREAESELTLDEIRTWMAVVALTGGMVLLSDDLSKLEPERLDLIPLLLPPSGEIARQIGPLVDEMPQTLLLDVQRSWENWHVVGLFNWSDAETRVRFDPTICGLTEQQSYYLYDLWTGQHYGLAQGKVGLEPIPAHGVRLLTAHKAFPRPQLLGTSLHLLGGVVELVGESWEDNTLRLELECTGERSGQLFVYVPEGYSYGDKQERGLLRLPVTVAGETEITLNFAGEAKL